MIDETTDSYVNERYRSGLYDESFETDACGIGLIVNATQGPSHSIVEQGLEILKNLAHRSALGADGQTSDGAGLMLQIPDEFFRRELSAFYEGDVLPASGSYAVAQIFSARSESVDDTWYPAFFARAEALNLGVIARRLVPVRSEILGIQAREIEPVTVQVFLRDALVQEGTSSADESRETSSSNHFRSSQGDFQARLYDLRVWCEKNFRRVSGCRDPQTGETLSQFYFCSLSTETIVYKGLMEPKNLGAYFTDLANPFFKSQFAMVHSRFSTNTLPAWELAQPFRFSCHNGEINTIRGNRQWMRARGFYLTEGRSDSNSFDEALELLMLGGRAMVPSMMMMIPEPWESNEHLAKKTRDFYAYHALRMEPWDGPAAICFSDGQTIGVCLDRNGLRPCRYQVLHDGTLIAGSETGAVTVWPSQVKVKGQLSPGKILVVDLKSGAIDLTNETKSRVAASLPYGEWSENERLVAPSPRSMLAGGDRSAGGDSSRDEPSSQDGLSSRGTADSNAKRATTEFWKTAARFGYHFDEIVHVILPMFRDKEEAISSMGYDTPLPLLSDRPQLLTHYFRQLFAQVTNPPIDPIREKSVMSLTTYLGPRASLTGIGGDLKQRWQLASPVLFADEMERLAKTSLKTARLETRFASQVADGAALGLKLDELCRDAESQVRAGADVVVISDLLSTPPSDVRGELYGAQLGLSSPSNCSRTSSGAGLRPDSLAEKSGAGFSPGDSSVMPVPALLAVSAIHQHLVKCGLRLKTSLLAETGEVRDSHQIACLVSFGADAVHPYLIEQLVATLQLEDTQNVHEFTAELADSGAVQADANTTAKIGGMATSEKSTRDSSREELAGSSAGDVSQDAPTRWLPPLKLHELLEHYRQAINKSLLKIMSKLGISTLQSYCGAQAFEILGLSTSLVERYFTGTATRIGGLDLEILMEETKRRWFAVDELPKAPQTFGDLSSLGDVHYRVDGEFHQWNPTTLSQLQIATRERSLETFKKFSASVRANDRFSLRGHLNIRTIAKPLAIHEVESAREIVKRFTTGAMSLGALSAEAHETLAIAMNRLSAKSNSGEGGEDAVRFTPQKNGDNKNSAIKQIASGRFGVTAHYLVNARELQIKMAQGAKPGEGGQLAGSKVDAEIARIRHSTPGVTLISPPPHHDIYSIEDLAQLIFDLRAVNPAARISVKLVSKAGVGTIAAGVAKAKAQKILISGDGGGTGASPLSSIRHAGVPWELGLAETHQTLLMNGLRAQVKLEADGQLRTGRDVAIAALLGADEFGFSTAPLVVEGCLMMRKCHLNTCPVGVATQDPELRKKFTGQPEHVINYFFFVAEELRHLMAAAGVRKVSELVGRGDLLEWSAPQDHWKAKSLDLSALFTQVSVNDIAVSPEPAPESFEEVNDISVLNSQGLQDCTIPVHNTDRAVGTWLSGEIARGLGAEGLPPGSIDVALRGSTGQSLGAFLAKGIRLKVVGEANDYVGKGLSGGRIVIHPDPTLRCIAHESSLVGNTCLYGATSGEVFLAGRAGERFAVRNSGATAVVEGVGDHGCEYMTGGCVVVLGETGKNFAAGMSGGLAYVFDESAQFRSRCNQELVDVEPVTDVEDLVFLFALISEHESETSSLRATEILNAWETSREKFVRVIPRDYRRILEAKKRGSDATASQPTPARPPVYSTPTARTTPEQVTIETLGSQLHVKQAAQTEFAP